MESFKSHKLLWIMFYLMLSQSSLASGTTQVKSREFTRQDSCKLQERIDKDCAHLKNGNYKNLIACSSMCRDNCTGVVFNGNRSCYVYKPCQHSIDCTQAEFNFYRKMNPCQHNSTWNVTTDTCKCVDNWVGESCERLPVHCGELREFGYPTGYSNRRWVKLDLKTYHEPVSVLCEVFDEFEYTLVMYSKGEFNNKRSWIEYVNGFYNNDFNFWLGLDKIKALNNAGLTSVIMSLSFRDASLQPTVLSRIFFYFKLDGPTLGYTFSFHSEAPFGTGPYKNLPYADCLGPIAGANFSTWDNDNDEDNTRNCAAQANVGWWFKDCNMVCNPLGWNYAKLPPPEKKSHVKMDGVNLNPLYYAKSLDISMYFHSVKT